MNNGDYPLFDFRAAGCVEPSVSASLKLWLHKAAEIFGERWKEIALTNIQVDPRPIVSQCFETAQSQINDTCLGIPIKLNRKITTFVVSKRSDLLSLILEVLGDTSTQKPADRPLTSVELSLGMMLLEIMARTLGEAWPQKDALPTEFGEINFQPHRSRIFGPGDFVLVTGFRINSLTGVSQLLWILPRAEVTPWPAGS